MQWTLLQRPQWRLTADDQISIAACNIRASSAIVFLLWAKQGVVFFLHEP